MTALRVALMGLGKHKIASLLITLTVSVAFMLYGLLTPISRALDHDATGGTDDQLVVVHKVSPVEVLPLTYASEIGQMRGVNAVTHTTWFGGYYQDLNNQRPMWAVEAEAYLSMHPELTIRNESDYRRWLATRNGVALGRKVAEAFRLRVGDSMPLKSYIWTRKDGSDTWQFEVSAIIDGNSPAADLDQVLIHYDFFDDNRSFGTATVGFFIVDLAPSSDSSAIASQIDARFANSGAPTRTATLRSFLKIFSDQLGNLNAVITGVLSLAFAITALMVCSHFLHSNHARAGEWALLEALGYSKRRLACYLVAEAGVVLVLGWLLGTSLAETAVDSLAPAVEEFLPALHFAAGDWLHALLICTAGVLLAVALPLRQLLRLELAPALSNWR